MYAVYLQQGRTTHAAAGHSNAPKYTASHSSTLATIPVHYQAFDTVLGIPIQC